MTTLPHQRPYGQSPRFALPGGCFVCIAYFVCAAAAAAPQEASAQAARPRSVYLERVRDEAADYLVALDERFGRGDFRGGARIAQDLLLIATGPEGSYLVPIPKPGLGRFDPDVVDPAGTVYETLTTAVYRRLRALPRRGRRAYERAVGAEAKERIARATASGRPRHLHEVEVRFLFTAAGDAFLLRRGDQAFEAGDLVAALGYYRRLAVDRGDPARVANRIAQIDTWSAGGDKAARRARGSLSGGAESRERGVWSWLGQAQVRSRLVSATPWTKGQSPGDVAVGLGVASAPLSGAEHLVSVLPGTVRVQEVVSAAKEAAGPWVLPPGASEASAAAGTSPMQLGWAATDGVLVAGVENARLFTGDLFDTAEGEDLRGERLGAAGSDVAERGVDLFAFDLEREGRLLWTTADAGPDPRGDRYAETRAWLGGMSWTGTIAAHSGVVIAVGVARRAEVEVHVAAFDARSGRLRFRRLLCAYSLHPQNKPPQPHVVIASGVAIVETGVGLVAGLCAATGEVRWITKDRRATVAAADAALAPLGGGFRRSSRTAAPVVLATTPPVALLTDPIRGGVDAIDPVTGMRAWVIRSHWPARVIGADGARALLIDREGVWLIDGNRAGRAISQKLPLPLRTGCASALVTRDRIVLALEPQPRRGARELLVVRIRELSAADGHPVGAVRLQPTGLLRTQTPIARAPILLPTGALAYVAGAELVQIPLGALTPKASAGHVRAAGQRYAAGAFEPTPREEADRALARRGAGEGAWTPGTFRVIELPSGIVVGDMEAAPSER